MFYITWAQKKNYPSKSVSVFILGSIIPEICEDLLDLKIFTIREIHV